MGGPAASCTRHPLREAVGICVRCSEAQCSDCITKIDGINYCRSCLTELGRAKTSQATPGRRGLPPALVLGLGFALLSLLTWAMLEVLLPGAGGS